jgi:hypothetical protein
MGKLSAGMIGIAMAMIMASCDDGPVGKAVNCRTICDHFDECFPDVEEGECRADCKDDVDKSDVEQCAECLEDDDSCGDCSAACAGVGIDMLFSR